MVSSVYRLIGLFLDKDDLDTDAGANDFLVDRHFLYCSHFENPSFPQPLQRRANPSFQMDLSIKCAPAYHG